MRPLLALLLLLLAPAGARAATVTHTLEGELYTGGGCGRYQMCDQRYTLAELVDAGAERNDVSVEPMADGVLFRDAGTPLTAGTGCAPRDGGVWCPPATVVGVRAGGGDDRAVATLAAARLDGGAGDDDLAALGAYSRADGGDGDDTLRGADAPGGALAGGAGADALQGGAGGEILVGGAGADTLRGDDGPNELRGGSGPDRLEGRGGDDRLGGRRVRCGDGADAVYAARRVARDCERAPLATATVLIGAGAVELRDRCERIGRGCRARMSLRDAGGTVLARARARGRSGARYRLRAPLPARPGLLTLRYAGRELRIG
jgi:hypothetical protein